MVRISEQLIRKRAEHNECIIGTLEELSLHQENIDHIGNLHDLCKNLRILYLQSNMIRKIVNLHKLKHLVYLNLALNNIEKIENLESLESLRKLDLTVNFIYELSSAKTLANNYNLRELYLMGNPCAQFEKYREYVIAFLPQLESLDGNGITFSERVKASRSSDTLSNIILQAEADHWRHQKEQDLILSASTVQSQSATEDIDECSRLKQFWDQESDHCPEARAEIARHSFERKQNEAIQVGRQQHQTCSAKVDRIYNMNQLKLQFQWRDQPRYYELVLKVFRYLETSFIRVFVHQYYLKVVIKNKVFQITYSEEVVQEKALVRRSRFSGHLKILLEKTRPTVCFGRQATTPIMETTSTYQSIEYNDAPNNEKQ